ncbi:MAG: TerB family tellurite resistance protein [Sandaracinus sp.]
MADAGLLVVTDILLGAAHADGTSDGTEVLAVRDLLKELHGGKELPSEVEARIGAFDPKKFSVEKAVAELKKTSKLEGRKLLELCATIRDADEEIDFAEDEYIKSVGKALGMKASEYADLTLDYEVEEAAAALGTKSLPPKPPTKK